MDEPTESAFAGYRFHRVLGGTSSGGSFEASEVATGDAVVIESLIGADSEDPDLREWFTEAWGALADLDHENLPDVHSTGLQGEVPFAVRSPIEGVRLPQLLDADEGHDPASIRILICRLADGLEQAHEAGVIHGALGLDDLIVRAEPGGEVIGRWVGFGRAEGRRSEDVLGLGTVLEALLEAERAAGVDGRAPMDEAILAMLNDVAGGIRDGSYRSAGAVRDAVAAGSEPAGAPGTGVKVLAAIAVLVIATVVILLVAG